MDRELTPEEKFAAEDPETMVPRALMQGRSHEDIIAELARLDWSRPAAEALIDRATADLRRFYGPPEARRKLASEARRQFATGLLLTLLGVALTLLTFLLAAGGVLPVLVVAFGLVLGGLGLAGRGWARWSLYGRDRLPVDPPSSG